MSTIASSVQLYDNISPVITGITSALNMCISSFEGMQAATSSAVDTTSFESARREINNIEMAMNQMESNINNAGNGQQNFNNRVVQGQSEMSTLVSKAKSLAETYLGFEAIKKAIDISDEMTQINARLAIMNYGLQSNEELQEKIYQSAQRSRASYLDTASAIAKMGLNARNAFASNDELIAFMEQINKQFVIGGASVEETKNAMIQLTQAMASGALRGEDLNSILAAAPEIARAIEKSMGWAEGSIKSYAEKGLVTADVVKKAMFKTADETEQRFNSMPKTFAQSMVMMKDQALQNFKPISAEINNLVNNPNFNSFINMLLSGFSLITVAVLSVIGVVANVAAFFQNNWIVIEPIILGVVAALAIYKGAMLAGAIATGIASLADSIYAVGAYNACASLAATELAIYGKISAQTLEAMATAEATAAQWGLNAALLSCPIVWIVGGIILLIVIFYAGIAAMDKFAGTSLSATGLIVGAFAMFGAYVYNIFAYVWNVTSAYVEFFANVFKHPIYSTEKLFINLADNVLNACISMTSGFDSFATNMANAMITGINAAIGAWNDFVDLLNSAGIGDKLGLGKGTELNYRTSITSDLQNFKGMLDNSISQAPDDYWTAPKMDMMSLGNSFDWGYSKGAGLESSATNWMSNLMNPQSDNGQGYDYSDLLNKAADGAAKTADNTGKANDKLDVTSEDLKYLRDIADRDTINRFTTAEVKVDMTNHNNIGSELDLDGIIDNLGQAVSEGLNQVREGATYDM